MTRSLGLAVLLLAAGCTTVAPYQRGHLARSDMGLDPSVQMRILDKTYTAKEAASGGVGVGGGGCGCN